MRIRVETMTAAFRHRCGQCGAWRSHRFNWAGQNCSIFGLHTQRFTRARLRSHTQKHTHVRARSLEVGARRDRAPVLLGAADIIVRAEGRRIRRQCAKTHRAPGNTESLALPCPLNRTVSTGLFWIWLRSGKNLATKTQEEWSMTFI